MDGQITDGVGSGLGAWSPPAPRHGSLDGLDQLDALPWDWNIISRADLSRRLNGKDILTHVQRGPGRRERRGRQTATRSREKPL